MFGREVFKHLSAWKADFVTSLERRKIPNELSGNYLFLHGKRINSQTTNLLNIPLFLADKTKELLAMQIFRNLTAVFHLVYSPM